MSFRDLVYLVFGNLARMKARVAMTAIGVVIGTAAVVVLVSLAAGLQRSFAENLGSIGDLTKITVLPASYLTAFGGPSPGRPPRRQTDAPRLARPPRRPPHQ